MNKIRLALIAGGTSGEREVSLKGATEVEQALSKEKYEVVRYDAATDLARLAADARQLDAAFILLHGIHGEDGTVQGMLELLGIPYQGAGVLGSALAMDKNLAKTMYRLHGLPVAAWEMASKEHITDPAPLLAQLSLPVVVKPIRQGSSLGMSVVRTAEQLSPALATAFEHDSQVMVEEFIQGREITVGVLGNEELMPLPLVEVIPAAKYEFFDYEAKYQPGATQEVCPAEVDDSIRDRAQQYGIKAHQALQLRGYSRTDMIVRENEIFLLETNTIPGMTPTSLLPQAAAQAGLDFPALLDRLIGLAME
ncbi:MAG: D-alanine--D-alanine ligase [Candidatus Electrothrix sp. GW3-4]|uniref:D-alanine--D-alanine ligase family protein n=1 Tax=Candidatus Electrothrix sp. GW3-4 TaxID=3126740 RepID=UPI0030D5112E